MLLGGFTCGRQAGLELADNVINQLLEQLRERDRSLAELAATFARDAGELRDQLAVARRALERQRLVEETVNALAERDAAAVRLH
jgi:hypothetical protein